LGAKFETPETMTVENLNEIMGPHFKKKKPLVDGFAWVYE